MNSINELLEISFLARSNGEQLEIKRLGKPKPILALLTTRTLEGGETIVHKFNENVLYEEHEWLCGCDVRNALFCFPCVLFGGDELWSSIGCKDVDNLSNLIAVHELNPHHLHNVINISVIGKKSYNENRKKNQEHNLQVDKNLKVLNLLIDTIKFCAHANIPILKKQICFEEDEDDDCLNCNAFDGMLKLVSEMNSTFEAYLKMELFQNELESIKKDILYSVHHVYQEEILREIEEAEFLSIIVEKLNSEDFSNVLILRYVVDHQPVERIWKLFTSELSGEDFFKSLKRDLEKIVVNPRKIISQSYSKLNLGYKSLNNDIFLKIQTHYPNAHLVHFYRHTLYDIITSVNSAEVAIFFSYVIEISNFFINKSWSSKALEIFEDISKNRTISCEKWNFQTDQVHTIFNYKEELLETFDSILEGCTHFPSVAISSAYNFRSELEEHEFQFLLEYFHRSIPHIESRLKEYENCLKLVDSDTYLNLSQEDLEKIIGEDVPRSPEPTSEPSVMAFVKVEATGNMEISELNMGDIKIELDSNLDEAKTHPVEQSRKRKFGECKKKWKVEIVENVMLQLHHRLHFRAHIFADRLVDPKNFNHFTTDFPDNFLEIVVCFFAMLDPRRLRAELQVLYERPDYQILTGTCALLKEIVENKLQSTFNQTLKLLNIVLTIPMKTPEDDRCFSTLEEVNHFLNVNSKRIDHLEHIMTLSCNHEFIKNICDFNGKVINVFTEQPERRENFKRQIRNQNDGGSCDQ